MKAGNLNGGHEWLGIQEANDCLIVIDSSDQVVICNDIAQRTLFEQSSPSTPSFSSLSLSSSFLTYDQHELELHALKQFVGENVDLLLKHRNAQVYPVKVSVTEIPLLGQSCFSIILRKKFPHEQKDADYYLRKSLSEALYSDLLNDQLEAHYQPQINAQDNSLFGVELLARWHNVELGYVPPDQFIAIAEEFKFVDKLDLWVLRYACRQLKQWRAQGAYVPSISVNFSPLTFLNDNIHSFIYASIKENGLSPSDLVIEVTEGTKIDEKCSIVEAMRTIHKMGVAISLDDFGTGHSNLKRLLKLPVSQLKLDRIFVKELSRSLAQELSEVVLNISKGLKVAIIAEGVEDTAQFELLKKLGYHLFQGYFFSRPLPQLEFDQWLKKQAELCR